MRTTNKECVLKPLSLIGLFCVALFFVCPSTVLGQSKTVSGTVTDAQTANSLPGVNIKVKGTTMGTSTDAEGQYELAVKSSQDTLVFSFVGYQTRQVPVNGREEINISLQSQAISGKEMVVVGYGTQQKKDLTGSVGSVDMKAVENQVISGANEALAGQIAGVQVNSSNGIPGGGPQIQVRGVAAIGAGSSPLYVVDGFALPSSSENGSQVSNPLSNIPSSDIASISVLKGPSATAIYGSRASNGVVIIQTKTGDSGELKFQVSGYTGVQAIPNNEKPNMMNAQEFAAFKKQFIEDKNRVTGSNDPIPQEYQNPSQYGEGTNWYDVITRVAPTQKVTVSASGGSDDIKSYISGSYLRQDGVVQASNYNRVSLRTNVDANIIPNLQIGLKFSPTYSYGNRSAQGSSGRGGFFGEWETLNPIESVYNPDGSYNSFITGPGLLGGPNPLEGLKEVTNYQNALNIIGNSYIKYDINNDLEFKTTLNVEWNNERGRYFQPSTIGAFASPPPSIPSGSNNENGYLNWVNENQFTYDHTFGVGHIKLLGNFSVQRQLYHSANFNGQQFPDNQIKTLNAATKITGGTDGQTWGLVSYLGRLNYSYKDRYLLTATVRRDGSSKFGPNNRWGTFPSIAVGWRITDEPWLANNSSLLSNLKIRAEYGLTGNDQIGTYAYTSRIQNSNYISNGNSLAPGKTINSLGNNNLSWEQSADLDIGLDVGLLADRINITADYYRSVTNDLLLNVEIPQSSGFSSALKNIGKIHNKGFEIGVKTLNISTNNFSWNSNLNFSLNRNKVSALGPNGKPLIANAGFGGIYGQNITQIGKPIGLFYGYKFLGLYQDQQDVQNSPSYAGAVPGAMKVADINGDGKITPHADFTIIGNPYPKFNYGITNTLTYKNLSLNIVITGSYGAQRFNSRYGSTHNIDGVFNVNRDLLNRWRSPDQPGDGKHPTTVGAQNRLIYRSEGTWSLQNASYFWVKNISLSYTLPHRITNGFRSIELYGSIQNALIITPYNGNPAATDYINGSTLTPGVDWNPYPVPRVSTIGVKINI